MPSAGWQGIWVPRLFKACPGSLGRHIIELAAVCCCAVVNPQESGVSIRASLPSPATCRTRWGGWCIPREPPEKVRENAGHKMSSWAGSMRCKVRWQARAGWRRCPQSCGTRPRTARSACGGAIWARNSDSHACSFSSMPAAASGHRRRSGSACVRTLHVEDPAVLGGRGVGKALAVAY